MNSSLIQLLSRGVIDINMIGADETLFRTDFNIPTPFYKQYDSEKSQILKFNDSLNIDINYDYHYLSENFVKIKIPYFQMFKNKISTSDSNLNSAINKIIYDNHSTYLFINNEKYYLILNLYYNQV